MKKFIAGALVLALSIGATQAQETKQDRKEQKKERKMHKKHEGDKSFANLNLTPDQKIKMKQLHEQQRTEMEAVRKNESLSSEQKQEQRKQIHEKYRSQFEAILTPEQKIEAQKMMQERKDQAKSAAGERKGKGQRDGMKIKEELNLSSDQQAQMKKLQADYKAKAASIRADEALTKEQKKAQMKDLHESRKAQLQSILTKEQAEKMKAGQEDRKGKGKKRGQKSIK